MPSPHTSRGPLRSSIMTQGVDRATHRSLFDNTLQGIALKDAPAFSFQGHPEASPGPHDLLPIFSHFITQMQARRAAATAVMPVTREAG